MDEKPCTHCKVGWMRLWLTRRAGVVFRVWHCETCGHSELSGIGEPAHD